jgi:hypothetical protein
MKIKNIFALVFSCSCIVSIGLAQHKVTTSLLTSKEHPRILLLKGEENHIKESLKINEDLLVLNQLILNESDEIILLEPIEYLKLGRRLLDKSQEALRRIFFLSYAYRMTSAEKYLKRAELELVTISEFPDWNPSHFLDTAEMTAAAAIGYDWLFNNLPIKSKSIIKTAIIEKGLKPSFGKNILKFSTVTHNWNQVCNAGMTLGALAIAEDDVELSKKIITRALETIHLPMDEYKPDGAYPEGYHYWNYGTTFNVVLLSALEKSFDTDFGLSGTRGFLKTAGFRKNMTGVTGEPFNWGDIDDKSALSPTMFWFANRNNNPNELWVEKKYLKDVSPANLKEDWARILPALLVWSKNLDLSTIKEPKEKMWVGQGPNPVGLMRTSWSDPNAIYVGFKAGSAAVNHGHMDVGSFVMESDGVRWSSDLGKQNYESLESKGLKIFGRTQDAVRWTIFRNNNYSHSTLTIDGKHQQVSGYAAIDAFSETEDFMYCISNLSTIYEEQLDSIERGIGIVDQNFVVVRDELKTTSKPNTTVRWAMLTEAKVSLIDSHTAILNKDGESLIFKINKPASITLRTWSTEPPSDLDVPNPNTVLIGFEYELPANTQETNEIFLIPGSKVIASRFLDKALKTWKF